MLVLEHRRDESPHVLVTPESVGEQHRLSIGTAGLAHCMTFDDSHSAGPYRIGPHVNFLRIGIRKVIACFNGVSNVPSTKTVERITMQAALITGGSKGLGLALAKSLIQDGWSVVIDGRDPSALDAAVSAFGVPSNGQVVRGIVGDVADLAHRAELVQAIAEIGRLDLVVNNASILGPSPQPALADYPLGEFEHVLAVNVIAPLALIQATLADAANQRRHRDRRDL